MLHLPSLIDGITHFVNKLTQPLPRLWVVLDDHCAENEPSRATFFKLHTLVARFVNIRDEALATHTLYCTQAHLDGYMWNTDAVAQSRVVGKPYLG